MLICATSEQPGRRLRRLYRMVSRGIGLRGADGVAAGCLGIDLFAGRSGQLRAVDGGGGVQKQKDVRLVPAQFGKQLWRWSLDFPPSLPAPDSAVKLLT
jgi:hypothetical protein